MTDFKIFLLRKNLSIICFNEKQWIGNGLTIPAGPLTGKYYLHLKRANDCVVINGEKNIPYPKIKYLTKITKK